VSAARRDRIDTLELTPALDVERVDAVLQRRLDLRLGLAHASEHDPASGNPSLLGPEELTLAGDIGTASEAVESP